MTLGLLDMFIVFLTLMKDKDNYFLTQEDAMDAGLLRALDLLKTRGVVWN